jgi:mannose-6-phosphate isomerase-like protein (cupin superfamily)
MKKILKPHVVNFFGRKQYERLLAGFPQTQGLKCGHVTLQPGESIGEHSTHDREEVIIVMAGEARIISKGMARSTVKKGSLVYIPPETLHNVQNIGRRRLSYLFVVAPVHGSVASADA